jgi:hypothetical protein
MKMFWGRRVGANQKRDKAKMEEDAKEDETRWEETYVIGEIGLAVRFMQGEPMEVGEEKGLCRCAEIG